MNTGEKLLLAGVKRILYPLRNLMPFVFPDRPTSPSQSSRKSKGSNNPLVLRGCHGRL